MALGSSAPEVFRPVLREGLLPVAAGLALGGVGVFLVRRALAARLFGLTGFGRACAWPLRRCWILLEQSRAAVDLVGHRLLPVKTFDLK